MPLSARARLTELAEDVVGHGSEKLRTKNGASCVALVDARKLDYYHALETKHAGLVLVQGALEGLEDLAAGRVLDEAELSSSVSRWTKWLPGWWLAALEWPLSNGR